MLSRHARSGTAAQFAKVYYFRSIISMYLFQLKSFVFTDRGAGDKNRDREIQQASPAPA